MLDQNDLRMIGALLDEKLETKLEEKLEEKLAPMKNDIRELKERLAPMEKDIGELKERLAPMEEDIGELKERLAPMEKDIGELKERLAPMEEDIGELKAKMDTYYNSLLSVFSSGEELYTVYKDDIPQMKNDITGLKIRSELYARRFTEMAQAAGSS